ncbi:MAG: RCC1 domain-containing protein, partial [Gammaproteobacteria bacterium]
GLDDSGQLGVGGRTQSVSPVAVVGLTGVVRVAAGNAHSLALRVDGSVWAWGANAAGQVGDGTVVGRRTPVDTGLRNIAAIAAGGDVSLALTSRRGVYGWGENSAGQLGRGAAFTSDLPTPAGLALDVVGASAADAHALLAKADGTVVGAGANASGEVGDATTTARNQYTAASVVTTAVAVTAGGKAHSLALRADGQLYSWGDNAAKQLGIASLAATGTSTPTLVPGFDATP